MFESVKRIGEMLLARGEVFFEVARLKGKGNLLAKVIFDLDNFKLDCDCSFQCDEIRAKEYFWVGNAVGQKPQLVLTTDQLEYLLDPSKPNKWAVGRIIKKIYELKLADINIKELQLHLEEVKNKFFAEEKSLLPEFEALLSHKGIERKDIILYTTCIRKNGEIIDLVKLPGYARLLRHVLYETESTEYPVIHARCHVCGQEKEVLTNPAYPEGTPLCIYNVDKTGFLPNLSRNPENMLRAHVVCFDCKEKLRIGLNFIERNLRATIGETSTVKLNVFLIPTFMGVEITQELLDKLAFQVENVFNAVKAYKSLEEVEETMHSFNEFANTYGGAPSTYFLNMLFGYRISSHFNFQHLIQNAPVTRLMELGQISAKLSNEAATFFSEESRKWSLGFEDIFAIFPLRKIRNVVEWKPIVELFNALINGSSYPKSNIIHRAVLFAKINRYGTYAGYNIKASKRTTEETTCRALLKYNLLLKYLTVTGVIEMERESLKNFKVPDENIEKFLSMQGYSEWQKALFLLGVLIGKIGIEQYKKGDEKKTVLNKVNFEGMSAERVKHLANYVLEGLRNYRALDNHSEALYGFMKTMMDRNLERLQNPIDNTFYILSGYSYITLQAITSGGDK